MYLHPYTLLTPLLPDKNPLEAHLPPKESIVQNPYIDSKGTILFLLCNPGHRKDRPFAAAAATESVPEFGGGGGGCPTYSLHCSSFFLFNQFCIKDPKR